ncbi:hypothetical protein ZIOFF_066828 [Zingiber officinale]|uniref:Gag-pol polyprotein n=1 Tax=Zingiber officinale TaxID=94328 RepID=A0A8J5F3Y8_ZINOF|nr:hypothetical protein ZIOFF_066828 [Zingiber officinale]
MSASAGNMFFTFSPNQIPIFDGEHFNYWSSQMETIFLSQDLWKLVEEGYEEVPEGISLPEGDNTSAEGVINPTEDEQKAYKENIMKNAMALRILQQSVSKTIYPRIFGLKKVNEAWEVLKKEFKGSQKVISIKLQNLWRDFDNIAMKDAENIKDYFSRIMEILNQLKSYGEVVPDRKIMEKILRSLPQKFEHVVTVIEEMKDLAEVSIYELIGSLEAHEKWNVLKTTEGPMAEDVEAGLMEEIEAMQKDDQKVNTEAVMEKQKQDVASAERIIMKQNIVVFDAGDASSQLIQIMIADMNEIWFLDSGCSNHVTGIKKNFVELDENYNSLLELGDSKKLKIEGKGVVSVFSAEGQQKRMHDVFYTPEIAQNLLSVGQMMKNGYKLVFAEGQCEITDRNGQKVAVMKMTSNNLFPLKMTPYSNVVLKTEVVDDSHLWHLRYGHLNRKGLALLKQKSMVLVLSRDVIFDEHTAWKWQEESSMTQMFQYTETTVEVTVQNPIGTTEASSSKTIPKAKGPIGHTPPRSTSRSLLQKFKEAMMEEFEMTDLGLMKYFLGFEVKQKKGEIFISQDKYIADLLKKFRMENAKSISTPMSLNEKLQKEDSTEGFDSKIYRSLVGSLIYLTHTRTDIVHSVSLLSRFMSNTSRTHFTTAKRVLRYLKGT